MSVLLTGFGPFGDIEDNPSQRLVRTLEGTHIAGHEVHSVVLPVETEPVEQLVADRWREVRPTLLLGTGVATGRRRIATERVAINVRDFPIPDAAGTTVIDQPVREGGPDAYLLGLPHKRIARSWSEAGIPGYVSNTAGTYLCNQLAYLLAELAARDNVRSGFLHLPSPAGAEPGEASTATPSAEQLLQAARTAIELSLTFDRDLSLQGGQVC